MEGCGKTDSPCIGEGLWYSTGFNDRAHGMHEEGSMFKLLHLNAGKKQKEPWQISIDDIELDGPVIDSMCFIHTTNSLQLSLEEAQYKAFFSNKIK